MSIVKNDLVLVLTGDSKGKISRVLSVNKKAKKVTVEGVNTAFKHVRRSRRNPQGGRLSMEMGIQISNVQLVCPGPAVASRLAWASGSMTIRQNPVFVRSVEPSSVKFRRKISKTIVSCQSNPFDEQHLSFEVL